MVAKEIIKNPHQDLRPILNPLTNQNQFPSKRLLSLKQTAEEFGPSVWFWRARIWAGEIPFIRANRKQLLDRSDIEKFLKSNKETHTQ